MMVTGKMENSTALAPSFGQMVLCTRGSGSTAVNRVEGNLLEKKAQFMRVNGLKGNTMDEVLCKPQQVRYTQEDGRMASF